MCVFFFYTTSILRKGGGGGSHRSSTPPNKIRNIENTLKMEGVGGWGADECRWICVYLGSDRATRRYGMMFQENMNIQNGSAYFVSPARAHMALHGPL